MKKLGIICGLGPEATVDYYKEYISYFKKLNTKGKLHYPELILYSVNMSVFIEYLQNNEYQKAAQYIAQAANSLAKAGADCALISANTPHVIFDEIQALSSLPLISIVEATKHAAQAKNLKKLGLIGTKFTMESDFFQQSFSKNNMEVIVPNKQDIEFIHQKVFSELELGIFKDSTRDEILTKINSIKQEHNIDGLILGCTEFPLLFTEESYIEIPFLNTTKIHVHYAIQVCATE